VKIRPVLATSAASAALLFAAAVAPPAGAAPADARSNVVFGKDVPTVPMAEWEIIQTGAGEQTGSRILIAAGEDELKRAPPNAARYDSKTFRFRNGEIRVLSFRKAAGGVLHQVTTETQLYVVAGSATVGVGGADVRVGPGDVVNLPSGVLRSVAGRPEDTTVVLYEVRSASKAPKASVVRAKDTPPAPIASGEKSGQGGAKVAVRRYAFDGNSIRVATLRGKGRTSVATPKDDVLIYLLSGRMQITIGDEVRTVAAGDALNEAAGLPTHWDVYEDSSFIATNAPGVLPPAAK
jgi:quercetin dioxygenase-like cupin family protein